MKRPPILLSLAAVAMIPASAQAEEPAAEDAAEAETSETRDYIAFANNGGVRNWQADGSDVIYFEASHDRWYRAELFRPAFDLPTVETIGIDAGARDRLDRFGAIVVRGERIPFTSFERVDGPPTKDEDEG